MEKNYLFNLEVVHWFLWEKITKKKSDKIRIHYILNLFSILKDTIKVKKKRSRLFPNAKPVIATLTGLNLLKRVLEPCSTVWGYLAIHTKLSKLKSQDK